MATVEELSCPVPMQVNQQPGYTTNSRQLGIATCVRAHIEVLLRHC